MTKSYYARKEELSEKKTEPLEGNPIAHLVSPNVTSRIKGVQSRGSVKSSKGQLSNSKLYRSALGLLPYEQWDIIFQNTGLTRPVGLIMPAEA